MFPRGEVGAGVLLVALGYGLEGLPLTFAVFSLALNLLLTGVFLIAVQWLIVGRIPTFLTTGDGEGQERDERDDS